MLTMNSIACGITDLRGEESVSISNTSSPLEFFAFSMNRVIVVSQILTVALTVSFFQVASFGGCEEKTPSLLDAILLFIYNYNVYNTVYII